MTTAVLICPGRGTYTKTELGTLARHFPDAALLEEFDVQRASAGHETLSKLDSSACFSKDRHGRGDNASGLIFAASLGDAMSISQDIGIVAVTGNSMGWYTTLACAGAVTAADGFNITTTMGQMMQDHGMGGQVLYPHVGPNWQASADQKQRLLALVEDIGTRPGHVLTLSIDLGGTLVLAGDHAGLAAFESYVPQRDRFPMRLTGHAGFHSPLVAQVSEAAFSHFSVSAFRQPDIPMIDGRGRIWWPHASDLNGLWDYTFGHQVTAPYDFTHAVTVAAREFAPDVFILAGPGTTLGSAVAQSLIAANWQGIASKADFQARQEAEPLLISMGREDQRALVTKGH
ncbi:MAG: ACP S-malonyltransferase [Pseudomonadota bacterium]